jgi:predicted nucleic acid-binding protein
LILDDQLGRRVADLYQLSYTGTLGVLIKAKKSGYLSDISSVISDLQNKGMWLSQKIIDEVLKLVKE